MRTATLSLGILQLLEAHTIFALKFDFVTVVYNCQIELNLLKLQAWSFSFVDKELINNIYILYNDKGRKNLNSLVRWYPEALRDRIKVIYRDDTSNLAESSWYNQQLMKLLVADHVESDLYVVLDCKDHFIRDVSKETFLPNGKPFMVVGLGGLFESYLYCLEYFGADCPFGSYMTQSGPDIPTGGVLETRTPYAFIKSYVIELRETISKNENRSFEEFFLSKASALEATEFYLYGAYIISMGRLHEYSLVHHEIREGVYSRVSDPWNAIDLKRRVVLDERFKVFCLHRKSLPDMDRKYKFDLVAIYRIFYTEDITNFISNRILQLRSPVVSHHYLLAVLEVVPGRLAKFLSPLMRKLRLIWKYQIRSRIHQYLERK